NIRLRWSRGTGCVFRGYKRLAPLEPGTARVLGGYKHLPPLGPENGMVFRGYKRSAPPEPGTARGFIGSNVVLRWSRGRRACSLVQTFGSAGAGDGALTCPATNIRLRWSRSGGVAAREGLGWAPR